MNYMEECAYMLDNFFGNNGIKKEWFTDEMIDQMISYTYKNFYSYEMDEEYAVKAAVSEVVKDNGIVIDEFEFWIP